MTDQRHGLLDSAAESEHRLKQLEAIPPEARAAFAVAAADRLLRRVEAGTNPSNQGPWRSLVNAIWDALEGNDVGVELIRSQVSSLERWLNDPRDEPPPELEDADDDHVAATLYAAEAFISGTAKAANAAGSRALDAVFYIAQAELAVDGSAFDQNMLTSVDAHALMQAEMRRQREDLELLSSHDVTTGSLRALRR